MGTAFKVLTLEIRVPVMEAEPFITVTGHYTAYPSGGVPQFDKDFEIFVERDEQPKQIRKIVNRLIAVYLDKNL